ncbi:prepilin peptidase [Granulicella sp. WH15]|uniref:prepilin peptidase n=1 Tax=Granulicella sp. WH15 TaxID=2602070 RepID=UPI001366BE12|nr:A24 family peptidase [Granulicella sp. WH15]QHN03332.1 prepilin peptidase [Granulicella sp. WH15]
MASLYIFELAGFLVGLLFGSFLNVCISRVPEGLSVVSPRSRCPQCGAGIRWFDNLPLVSWVLLRARCRDCGKAIPWRYPAVELAVGVWFAVVVRQLAVAAVTTPGEYIDVIGFAVLGFLLIGLIVIDWQTLRLPDEFTLLGVAMGLFLVCSQAIFLGPGEDQIVLNTSHQLRLSSPGSFAARGNVFLTGPEALIFGRIAAVVGAALLLLMVRWIYRALRKQDGLGLGDVKMLAMIAAFLGFWPTMVALFVGVLCAALYGTVLMLRGRAHGLTKLPLGSFLGIGGLVAALWGDRVVEWYRGLLG